MPTASLKTLQFSPILLNALNSAFMISRSVRLCLGVGGGGKEGGRIPEELDRSEAKNRRKGKLERAEVYSDCPASQSGKGFR